MAYYVVRGKVNHSQRLSETPLQAWFICGEEGNIITAHCNCMAGLGETCSHLASIMFFIEAAVRLRDKQTVTQEAAYWKLPSVKRQVEYAPIKQIKVLHHQIASSNRKGKSGSLLNENFSLMQKNQELEVKIENLLASQKQSEGSQSMRAITIRSNLIQTAEKNHKEANKESLSNNETSQKENQEQENKAMNRLDEQQLTSNTGKTSNVNKRKNRGKSIQMNKQSNQAVPNVEKTKQKPRTQKKSNC